MISVEYLFSTFFLKTVKELKIPSISDYTHIESSDSLKAALDQFENFPSIVNIKRKGFDASFTSKEFNSNEVIKVTNTYTNIRI